MTRCGVGGPWEVMFCVCFSSQGGCVRCRHVLSSPSAASLQDVFPFVGVRMPRLGARARTGALSAFGSNSAGWCRGWIDIRATLLSKRLVWLICSAARQKCSTVFDKRPRGGVCVCVLSCGPAVAPRCRGLVLGASSASGHFPGRRDVSLIVARRDMIVTASGEGSRAHRPRRGR